MHSESGRSSEVLERFCLGFSGTTLPEELAAMLSAGLAGVAIYPRNYDDLAGLQALTGSIRSASGQPVLIGADQGGGGRFALKPPFTAWPSPAELGALGDVALVERVARAMAREMSAVGLNLDFAPMLDLATNPASPITSGRAFGADPQEVARMGVAFLRGLAAEGVLGCAKHFPGHGDTAVDPHFDLPTFDGTREGLVQREMAPFAAAIEAGVPLVMTAHILIPQVDPDHPASISRRILGGLLRHDLHFAGVILADDLGMGAIARLYGPGESVVKTLEAGSEIAMLCHDSSVVPEAIAAVAESLAGGRFEPAQWSAARARIARLRRQIETAARPAPPLDVIGCAEHRAIAEEIRARLAHAPK